MNVTRTRPIARPPRATRFRAPARRIDAGTSRALRNLVFRATVATMLVSVFLTIRHVKATVWPQGGHPPRSAFDLLVQAGAITWALALPWALADVAGWLAYRRHTPVTDEARRPNTMRPMRHPVAFRIVTRGDQPATVIGTVWSVLEAMQRRPLFRYRIEVVSDMPVEGLPVHEAVHAIVVPEDYETNHGATHKARALHYALTVSPVPDHGWVLHLDEESHVTEDVIIGIREAVTQEERAGTHRIGQGLITYHRDLHANRLFSLADSIRVGDDMGRFHLQYRLHRILFGMHGSFLLVRTNVEREVGFDFPPEACTTEDTTWALRQMAKGNRFRWVNGTVVEQSPSSFGDFVRQRRRWFTGMWWAARKTPVPASYRRPLWLAQFLWTTGWTGFAYSLLHIFSGVVIPGPLAIVGDFIFAVFVTNYLLGLWVSLSMREGARAVRHVGTFLLQAVYIPIFTVLEASAVVYSLISPERRFHVIEKPAHGTGLAPAGASRDPSWFAP